MIKLRKATFQHVESEMYAYHETRREIIRLKNEILYGKGNEDENTGGGRSSLPGDPTGMTAVLLVSHKRLEQLQAVVNAIELVVNGLPDGHKELVKLKYWTKPQTLTWDGIAHKLHVSKRQALRWRDEVVQMVGDKIGWR